MRKILIPCDGSDSAVRAVQFAARLARELSDVQIEMLYVEDPVPLRMHASLSNQQIDRLQSDEGGHVLQRAKAVLDTADLSYEVRYRAGTPAHEIAHHAQETCCDAIIMGTRGLGPVAGVMMGSVASRVVHLVDVPVTLVK
jgi:nucleotide-binding universal stress UspA family protein